MVVMIFHMLITKPILASIYLALSFYFVFNSPAVYSDSRLGIKIVRAIAAPSETVDYRPGMIALTEIVILSNAVLATVSPKAYGAATILYAPFRYSEQQTNFGNTAEIGSNIIYGSINVFEFSKSKYSDAQVLLGNIIGWHAFAAITFYSNKHWRKRKRLEYFNISVLPEQIELKYSLKF